MVLAVIVEGGLSQGEVAGRIDDVERERLWGLAVCARAAPGGTGKAGRSRAPPMTARREICSTMFPLPSDLSGLPGLRRADVCS